jgi:hypothetical protein
MRDVVPIRVIGWDAPNRRVTTDSNQNLRFVIVKRIELLLVKRSPRSSA